MPGPSLAFSISISFLTKASFRYLETVVCFKGNKSAGVSAQHELISGSELSVSKRTGLGTRVQAANAPTLLSFLNQTGQFY